MEIRKLFQNINNIANEVFKNNFGQKGADFITDTSAYAGSWIAIKADGAADAVFTTLTTSEGDNLDTITLVAGDVIYGPFTNIQLTSGKAIAYKK